MCRNIKTLANFEPPASDERSRLGAPVRAQAERDARPSRANEAAFDPRSSEVTAAARRLIDALQTNAPPRDRDEEIQDRKERARTEMRVG